MRFQPRQGRLLAAAAENVVSIYDVESETCVHTLQVFFFLQFSALAFTKNLKV